MKSSKPFGNKSPIWPRNTALDRPPKISLIGLVELEDRLSQVLGVKVDLAIKTNLKKRIGKRILQEVIPL